jgi:hypothetical protein
MPAHLRVASPPERLSSLADSHLGLLAEVGAEGVCDRYSGADMPPARPTDSVMIWVTPSRAHPIASYHVTVDAADAVVSYLETRFGSPDVAGMVSVDFRRDQSALLASRPGADGKYHPVVWYGKPADALDAPELGMPRTRIGVVLQRCGHAARRK